MKTIVMFYRALIWLAFAVSLLLTGLLVSAGLSTSEPNELLGGFSIVLGIAIMVLVVLTLGASATLVSIHDRLVEVVERLER